MIAWKLWASVPKVELWEAVALVLEIDPRSLTHSPHGWMAGPRAGPIFEPGSFPNQEKRAAFDEALLFAERATTYSGPIRLSLDAVNGRSYRNAFVSLREVVEFFLGCEWQGIPAPLLALVESQANALSAGEPAPAAVAPPTSEPATADAIARAAPDWQEIAREVARSIRKDRDERLGTAPSLEVLGDEVAKVFRERDIKGPNGHALTGAYIKRHALQGHGITSPADKLRSIGKHRGK